VVIEEYERQPSFVMGIEVVIGGDSSHHPQNNKQEVNNQQPPPPPAERTAADCQIYHAQTKSQGAADKNAPCSI
jgi:hypothetical protein